MSLCSRRRRSFGFAYTPVFEAPQAFMTARPIEPYGIAMRCPNLHHCPRNLRREVNRHAARRCSSGRSSAAALHYMAFITASHKTTGVYSKNARFLRKPGQPKCAERWARATTFKTWP